MNLHEKHLRRIAEPENIIIWARYYQVKDVISVYKKKLKETYTHTDEESRALAKKIRKELELAVEDLDKYQASLETAKIPLTQEKLTKKVSKKDKKRGTARETRDASADRKAFLDS